MIPEGSYSTHNESDTQKSGETKPNQRFFHTKNILHQFFPPSLYQVNLSFCYAGEKFYWLFRLLNIVYREGRGFCGTGEKFLSD
jgi:hypothetical protein